MTPLTKTLLTFERNPVTCYELKTNKKIQMNLIVYFIIFVGVNSVFNDSNEFVKPLFLVGWDLT